MILTELVPSELRNGLALSENLFELAAFQRLWDTYSAQFNPMSDPADSLY